MAEETTPNVNEEAQALQAKIKEAVDNATGEEFLCSVSVNAYMLQDLIDQGVLLINTVQDDPGHIKVTVQVTKENVKFWHQNVVESEKLAEEARERREAEAAAAKEAQPEEAPAETAAPDAAQANEAAPQ